MSESAEKKVFDLARKSGGGGHRQAAGFSSEASVDEVVDFIRREYLAQVGTGPH
jgi:phosphoesterase RecJ-like protein